MISDSQLEKPVKEEKQESDQSAAVTSPALSLSLYLSSSSGREGRSLRARSQGDVTFSCEDPLTESTPSR